MRLNAVQLNRLIGCLEAMADDTSCDDRDLLAALVAERDAVRSQRDDHKLLTSLLNHAIIEPEQRARVESRLDVYYSGRDGVLRI